MVKRWLQFIRDFTFIFICTYTFGKVWTDFWLIHIVGLRTFYICILFYTFICIFRLLFVQIYLCICINCNSSIYHSALYDVDTKNDFIHLSSTPLLLPICWWMMRCRWKERAMPSATLLVKPGGGKKQAILQENKILKMVTQLFYPILWCLFTKRVHDLLCKVNLWKFCISNHVQGCLKNANFLCMWLDDCSKHCFDELRETWNFAVKI